MLTHAEARQLATALATSQGYNLNGENYISLKNVLALVESFTVPGMKIECALDNISFQYLDVESEPEEDCYAEDVVCNETRPAERGDRERCSECGHIVYNGMCIQTGCSLRAPYDEDRPEEAIATRPIERGDLYYCGNCGRRREKINGPCPSGVCPS